jgi:hypothetical protein
VRADGRATDGAKRVSGKIGIHELPFWCQLPRQGFALLGRALEAASSPSSSPSSWSPSSSSSSSSSFESQVQADLLSPLGMTPLSGFNWTDEVLTELARGGGSAGAVQPVTRLGWAAPGGEMFATAADMARFLNFLTQQTPPPPPQQKQQHTPADDDADNDHDHGDDEPMLLSQWRKDEWLLKVGALMPDGVSGCVIVLFVFSARATAHPRTHPPYPRRTGNANSERTNAAAH